MIKRLEMRDLWKAENPDEKAILAKQKELNALRDQMMEKMVPFRLEAKKIAPHRLLWHGHAPWRRYGHGHGRGLRYGSRRRHGHGPWNGAACATGKIVRLLNPSELKGPLHGPSATSRNRRFFSGAALNREICPRLSHHSVIKAPQSPYSSQFLPISWPTTCSGA